jgi:hypothetical protein
MKDFYQMGMDAYLKGEVVIPIYQDENKTPTSSLQQMLWEAGWIAQREISNNENT